jgi:hypothetical protein
MITSRVFIPQPRTRSPMPLYRHGESNHCPGCGRTHWLVGRFSAECAFCSVVLMFASADPHHVAIAHPGKDR